MRFAEPGANTDPASEHTGRVTVAMRNGLARPAQVHGMAIVAVDDTDSRSGGMCTTWIGSEIADRLPDPTAYLVRLCPAVEHKTRGNGAVAVADDTVTADALASIARDLVTAHAVLEDPETNPGVVAVESSSAPTEVIDFGRSAVHREVTREEATTARAPLDARTHAWGNGRGLIGATAAVAAVLGRATGHPSRWLRSWSYETIAYREHPRWGTERTVSVEPAKPIIARRWPAVWDTIDPTAGVCACVPNSPCPVLFGIRGDDPDDIAAVVAAIDSEPIARHTTFHTNQGTDGHLRPATIAALTAGRSFRTAGTVGAEPRDHRGGRVTVPIVAEGVTVECVAFAPTGPFRHIVRGLRPGDRIIACGEVEDGSLKLEKLALTNRSLTVDATPRCPGCNRTMESAGRDQGFRCRSCGTTGRYRRRVPDRSIAIGWYEVPPGARRHLAAPLARVQTDLPAFAYRG